MVYGVHTRPSSIEHLYLDMGCFENQDSREGYVIGYFYETLAHQVMVDALNARGVHVEDVTVLTREELHISVITLKKKVQARMKNYVLFG